MRVQAERGAIEVGLCEQRRMLVPAAAIELDTVDGGMQRPREALDAAKGGQPDACVPVPRAREAERPSEGVHPGHVILIDGRSDGRLDWILSMD